MDKPHVAHPDKAALRKLVFARRDALDPVIRATASAKIAERVMALVVAEKPRTIAAYLPVRSECDSRVILEAADRMSLTIALPAVIDPVTMVFRRYRPGDPLVAGGHGTLAPESGQPVLDPDLIVLPLVAFDRKGLRLGHGRGFYDRAIAALNGRGVGSTLIGVGFATQEVEAIPGEPHDARLDWIVTENETLDLRRQK